MSTSYLKIDEYGTKHWRSTDSGRYHREGDEPAIEYLSGSKEWWINGKWHREDGPAFEYVSGYKAWLINGKYHRIDGPAIESANGIKSWYYHDQYIDCQSQEEFERMISLLIFE